MSADARQRGRLVEDVYDVVDQLQPIARSKDCTLVQLALAWVMQQPGITSPIIGPRTLDQLEEYLGAAAITLDQADLDTEALVSWARQQPFPPHATIQSARVRGSAVRVLLRQVVLPDQISGGLIIIRPIDELLARLTRVAALLVGGMLGVVAVASLLAWQLAGMALAPVRAMSAAAREISEHDLKRRVHSNLPSDDELGELEGPPPSESDRAAARPIPPGRRAGPRRPPGARRQRRSSSSSAQLRDEVVK